MREPKLFVVSARLPVRLSLIGQTWRAGPSPGGLATALRSVAETRSLTWVGWPGARVRTGDRREVTERLPDYTVPVFLEQDEYEGFYEQFSNRLLWPLFHNISGRLKFDRQAWAHYGRVNEHFADAVCDAARPGDVVWVHDYQLALLPQLLRRRGLVCAIGFFLHIPFPSHETYRTLPVRSDLLRGMLGADLIGFHTYEFAQHFRNACLRVLGLGAEQETIVLPSHNAHLGVHPIGIDPEEILALAEREDVRDEAAQLRRRFGGKRVVLGVDRLDYTKGIPEKLLAFEEFLLRNPEWRSRVVLIQVAAPSRTGVLEYQELKREVDELVGRINGRYGTFNHVPIVYINQSIPLSQLAALYNVADVAFITPLRDGMNLVALEYVAARGVRPGTLVLSEFAGAASCLSGARLVNPHNTSLMADVLRDALEGQTTDEAFARMREFVHHNTATVWADRFLRRLDGVYEAQRIGATRLDLRAHAGTGPPDAARLMLLDYGGTLQPLTPIYGSTAPEERLRKLLTDLASLGSVYVLSGQPADVLDDWFRGVPIGLVCEHGLAVRAPGDGWSDLPTVTTEMLDDVVKPVLVHYFEHTPGSKLERRPASLAWQYRTADPKLGPMRAKELYAHLEDLLRNSPYTVVSTAHSIEVRPSEFTKARVGRRLLDEHPSAAWVFCAGNDKADEEMFEALQRSDRGAVLSCYVGGKHTIGRYYVESPAELLKELEFLAVAWKADRPFEPRVARDAAGLPGGLVRGS